MSQTRARNIQEHDAARCGSHLIFVYILNCYINATRFTCEVLPSHASSRHSWTRCFLARLVCWVSEKGVQRRLPAEPDLKFAKSPGSCDRGGVCQEATVHKKFMTTGSRADESSLRRKKKKTFRRVHYLPTAGQKKEKHHQVQMKNVGATVVFMTQVTFV